MTATMTATYVQTVRALLDDLPTATVDDLVEGLEEHLAEVATDERPLEDILGSPERYAAELRSSAGLPPRVERPPSSPLGPAPADPPAERKWTPTVTLSPRALARAALVVAAALFVTWLVRVAEGGAVLAALVGLPLLWLASRATRVASLGPRRTPAAVVVVTGAALALAFAAGATSGGGSSKRFYGPEPTKIVGGEPTGPTVVVPDLRGLSIADATTQAVALGFAVVVQPVTVSGPPGVVVDQTPPPGAYGTSTIELETSALPSTSTTFARVPTTPAVSPPGTVSPGPVTTASAVSPSTGSPATGLPASTATTPAASTTASTTTPASPATSTGASPAASSSPASPSGSPAATSVP